MMYLVDYICAILARIANVIFHILPIQFTLWLGKQCGTVACFVNTERRMIGYANLKAAFSKEKTPREIKALIKAVYQNLTKTVFEILSLTKLNRAYAEKYIEVVNEKERKEMAKDMPNGAILITAHFGNWEMQAGVSAMKGFPLIVLARPQRMKKMNELIDRLRESMGSTIIRKGMTTRMLVKALHQGKIVGVVGDQDAGKKGIFVDFFGRPASTAPGAARIAQKTGAYFMPVFIARIKGPYHRLVLEEPVKIGKEEGLAQHLARYNELLESYVRKYPEQYLWMHRRWKSTPVKQVIILDDGKAGHLNQALALGKLLKEYRVLQDGYRDEDTRVNVVKFRFKNKFAKLLLQICVLFSGKRCQGCMFCLKACLTKDSYDDLMRRYCDVVISAGSSASLVNRFLALENNSKNAVVMKPQGMKLNKFNMVVLPWHDRKRGAGKEAIIVDTAPNLIDEEYLRNAASKMQKLAVFEKESGKIGVLLGGDNKDYALTPELTRGLLESVLGAARKKDTDLLFTTSRRTPKESEIIVADTLRPEKRCRFLVIANEKNIPDAVGGILALSDIVVVSGESISMISEAIASGKRVIVFSLEKKKKGKSKFENTLNHLKEKNFITLVDGKNLRQAIEESLDAGKPQTLPEDRFNVYKYMWRLL